MVLQYMVVLMGEAKKRLWNIMYVINMLYYIQISRKLIWLKVMPSNHNSLVVARCFLEAVKEVNGKLSCLHTTKYHYINSCMHHTL